MSQLTDPFVAPMTAALNRTSPLIGGVRRLGPVRGGQRTETIGTFAARLGELTGALGSTPLTERLLERIQR